MRTETTWHVLANGIEHGPYPSREAARVAAELLEADCEIFDKIRLVFE